MNVDLGSFLVLFLVWCLGIGPSHQRTGKSKGDNSDSLKPVRNSTFNERGTRDNEYLPEDVQVGCRELRAKRYISDGFCTSVKAIREVVCAGNCLPIRELPWYSEFVQYWSKDKLKEWQCEEDLVRRKKVRLLCDDGSYRTYKIKVVKSCKCKKTVNEHNRTKRRRRRRKQRKNKKNRRQKQKTSDSSNAP